MNYRLSQPGTPEQLPAEFPQSLCEVDALLAKQSRQMSVPVGLAERIVAASRPAYVAATRDVEAAPSLRLVPAPRPMYLTPWARLAMAACVGLAFVVAFIALQPSRHTEPRMATIESSDDQHTDLLASAVDSAHATDASHYEANLSYLIESQSLGADDLDALKGELAMLVARF